LEVFSEFEGVEELWMAEDVQKQVKAMCVTKRAAGERKTKDPNAPKRGKSAYLFFCAEHRTQVKSDLGEESKNTDVTRELGARWNLLRNSTKGADKKEVAKFTKLAEGDKARYETEKESYTPPENSEEHSPKRRGKRAANTGPKRGKSAYLYFCADNRPQVTSDNPDFKATEITAELGRLWNELKTDSSRADEMAAYERRAGEDKARYESEKAEAGIVSAPAKARAPAKATAKATASAVKAPAAKAVVPVKGAAKKNTTAPKVAAAPKPQAAKKGRAQPVHVEEDEDEVVEEVVEEVLEEEEEQPRPAPSTKSKACSKAAKGASQPAPAQVQSSSQSGNGYQSFCNAKRAEFKDQFPKAKAPEITKKLSAAWKALSDADQAEWRSGTATA
jgi:hypothetical protein